MKTTNSFSFQAKTRKNNLTSKGIIHTHTSRSSDDSTAIECWAAKNVHSQSLSFFPFSLQSLCACHSSSISSGDCQVCVCVGMKHERTDLHLVILYENFFEPKESELKWQKWLLFSLMNLAVSSSFLFAVYAKDVLLLPCARHPFTRSLHKCLR